LATAAVSRGGPRLPYIFDIARNVATRLPMDGTMSSTGWTRGGDSLLYSEAADEVMAIPVVGGRTPSLVLRLQGWSMSDTRMSVWGPWIAFVGVQKGDSSSVTQIALAHRDSAGAVRPLNRSRFVQGDPTISPDGQWIAYTTTENGRSDVFVSRFPVSDGRFLVSPSGGEYPSWSSDSRTIFFQRSNQIMAASMTPPSGVQTGSPALGAPRMLYTRAPWGLFDIMENGKTILFVDRVREGDPQALVVTLNALARP
jgi:hypothetical protein